MHPSDRRFYLNNIFGYLTLHGKLNFLSLAFDVLSTLTLPSLPNLLFSEAPLGYPSLANINSLFP